MEWYPYRLKLTKPVRMPAVGWVTHREGVRIYDPETDGWGDAAPLPGVSEETIADVLKDLDEERWQESRLPSLRFAVECARAPWPGPGEPVKLNALWLADQEPLEKVLTRIQNWPQPTVKLKPGPDPDPEGWCRLLTERPDAVLRIDPNRGWTVEELRRYTAPIPPEKLEYVEEPLSSPTAYLDLSDRDDPPVALDESLREPGGDAALASSNIRALVLKPTLMGHEADRASWIRLAEQRGIRVVWSSSVESGLGLWHLARLAAGGEAAGLDTASWLEEDVVTPRPVSGNGVLELPERLQVTLT